MIDVQAERIVVVHDPEGAFAVRRTASKDNPEALQGFELVMCGRVIQKSGPLRLVIVEGLDVSDSRVANVRPSYNAAPRQELLVIPAEPQDGRAFDRPSSDPAILDFCCDRGFHPRNLGFCLRS